MIFIGDLTQSLVSFLLVPLNFAADFAVVGFVAAAVLRVSPHLSKLRPKAARHL
jgi:hypothetical protein